MSILISAQDARVASVLERVHQFEGDGEEDIKFVGTIVVLEVRENIYICRSKEMLPLEGEGDITVEGLEGISIRVKTVFPSFIPETFTAADESLLPSEIYLKRPSLVDLYETDLLDGQDRSTLETCVSKLVLREATVCELLRKFPNEHIVMYYGCKVLNGRIAAFYLEKLFETLLHRVNRLGNKFDMSACLSGLQKGLDHIHSLGFCHNDINDQNVMFRRNGCPVIIDFNSCQPIGEKLSLTCGTEDWCDNRREYSLVENDDDAMKRIARLIEMKMKQPRV